MMLRRTPLFDTAWTRFVQERPEALPYHHPAWAKAVANCYGFEPFALVLADSADRIIAGLPVIKIDRRLRADKWSSLPFTDYCPPLAVSDTARAELVQRLDALRRNEHIGDFEIKSAVAAPGFGPYARAWRHELALQKDSDAVYATFKPTVKRDIQRAIREGATVRVAIAARDLTDEYYHLHVLTHRRLGVPVQPRRFFRRLWHDVIRPGLGILLLASVGDRTVAGAVFLNWAGTVSYKYGASDHKHWRVRPNHLVLWEAISWASESGYRAFDFGRTDITNAGLRRFKQGWGTKESELIYSLAGRTVAAARMKNMADRAGPVLRRAPPWVSRATGELLYKRAA